MNNPVTLHDTLPPRSIDLTPKDWCWASWLERKPQAHSKPKPFELQQAVARLKEVAAEPYSSYYRHWAKSQIRTSLNPQEAHFWFTVMTAFSEKEISRFDYQRKQGLLQELTDMLAQQTFTGQITLNEVRERLAHACGRVDELVVIPLANLFSPAELVDLILQKDKIPLDAIREGMRHYHYHGASKQQVEERARDTLIDILSTAFRTHVLPYLPDKEIEPLRSRIQPFLNPADWPGNRGVYRLAAGLKMPAEVQSLVQSWPDGSFKNVWGFQFFQAQELVFSLGSPQLIATEARRLKLRLRDAASVRAFLALTQYDALDVVADSILALTEKKQTEALLKAFAIVHAPEAAPHMLAIKQASKAPQLARQWLDDNPEHAIAGLMSVVEAGNNLSEAAMRFLLRMQRKGYGAFIQACLAQMPPDLTVKIQTELLDVKNAPDYTPFDENTTPDWLENGLPSVSAAQQHQKADWADPVLLPPVVVGMNYLNETQIRGLITLLKQSPVDQPVPALITALKTHANRQSLDIFAWELFELWLEDGAPSREKWALGAVGLLGSDALALKLTPFIRTWPGESQHQRAVFGLRCLQAIGTDTALMQINGIAQNAKFKGLKARAREAIETIAQERNLTREQLEDRVVPDCGLDERGKRAFDFGPRQFQFVLSPEMKPMVRDDKGKLRANLPKPGKRDEADLTQQAIADWKLLKKQIREVAKIQAFRLEQAMVTGRRWPIAEFEQLLVRHPLMVNLVRLLLWGGYDTQGQLVATFRVTEDQTYADVNDDDFSLAGFQEVGLVHPLPLSDETKSAWGELFSDYEIVPPFPQLGREIYTLEVEEVSQTEITRFAQLKIPAVSLVGTLEKLGWQRGIPADAGVFYEHAKPFYGANVTAVVEYEGVPVGYMIDWEDQSLERCFFVPGIYTPKMYPQHKNKIPLGEIEPVVISEVLRELTQIAGKARE